MDAAALNQMLENRVRTLAARRPAGNAKDHGERVWEDVVQLRRCLGLEPLPPRSELNLATTGVLLRDGYRIEKLRYESLPGWLVTAHLYVPEGPGPFPVLLRPHGHSAFKKQDPVSQASAISAALYGFAVLVVDSPGYSWDLNPQNERSAQGDHADPWLSMARPVNGAYVWDLMRGLDALQGRAELDLSRVGCFGESGGGTATMYAFALDPRIRAAAPIISAASMETMPHNGCLCNHVPGVLELGDRADILALRAPLPVLLIGAKNDPEFPPEGLEKTAQKLKQIYKAHRAQEHVRLEIFEGSHDFNRRMRESCLAFFREHLYGDPPAPYRPEMRPLTDGWAVPAVAGTEPPESPELSVTAPHERSSLTFREVMLKALAEPYPQPFDAQQRLAPWGRPRSLKQKTPGETLTLIESGEAGPGEVLLPFSEVDQKLAIYLGLSLPEFFAQVLHLLLPGVPDGWEPIAASGDILTSMIASMKTLVKASENEVVPTRVVARGPAASQTAFHLALLRPGLVLDATHAFASWQQILESGDERLVQPLARYLDYPKLPPPPVPTEDPGPPPA